MCVKYLPALFTFLFGIARNIVHLRKHESHHDKNDTIASDGRPLLIASFAVNQTATIVYYCVPQLSQILKHPSGRGLGQYGPHSGTIPTPCPYRVPFDGAMVWRLSSATAIASNIIAEAIVIILAN